MLGQGVGVEVLIGVILTFNLYFTLDQIKITEMFKLSELVHRMACFLPIDCILLNAFFLEMEIFILFFICLFGAQSCN